MITHFSFKHSASFVVCATSTSAPATAAVSSAPSTAAVSAVGATSPDAVLSHEGVLLLPHPTRSNEATRRVNNVSFFI
jgi:hypothetical protein